MAKYLERLQSEMKEAMKAGEKERLGVIRMLIADIKKEPLVLGHENLTELEEENVIKRALKARRDSIDQAEKANRQDIVQQEKSEIRYVEVYLPKQMDEAEITQKAREMCAALGITQKKDMGRFMKEWQGKYRDVSDGKLVQRIVSGLLS
jgi:uncharacterized protein YqeY